MFVFVRKKIIKIEIEIEFATAILRKKNQIKN